MGFYNNAGGLVQTLTRIELIQEIKLRLDRGQTNLNDIDVSKVKEMAGMFCGCTDFNCDLSGWNTKSLIFSSEIFFNSGIKEKPKWCC